MAGSRKGKNRNIDWEAADRLASLLADRGWTPRDVQVRSERTGHPQRTASYRVVYRVLNEGHRPTNALQFEIAATFGLLPSHIWGNVPIPNASEPSSAVAVAA